MTFSRKANKKWTSRDGRAQLFVLKKGFRVIYQNQNEERYDRQGRLIESGLFARGSVKIRYKKNRWSLFFSKRKKLEIDLRRKRFHGVRYWGKKAFYFNYRGAYLIGSQQYVGEYLRL